MQPSKKSTLALFVLIPVLALAGCQKGGDSTQPTSAVTVPGGGAADSHVAAAAGALSVKSDQDPQHPIYEIETSLGRCVVRLDAEKAPLTVDNFRNYVARGHYDLTIFHQVLNKGVQIVVGGGYTADLKERTPLTPIRSEAHNGLKNRRGTIAMVRRADDEDSATCQFFINITDNDALNFKARSPIPDIPQDRDYRTDKALNFKTGSPESYGYCVFGEVTEGMEVVDRIAKSPVHDIDRFASLPVESVVIKTIRQVK